MMKLLLHVVALLVAWQTRHCTANIVNCGFCVCERTSITCDFDAAKARIKDNIQLAEFVPTATQLRSYGLDPLSFEDLYVNCKNSRVLQNQRLTKDILEAFANLKKIGIVRCDLTAIDADAFQRLYKLEEFDASDNNLNLLPPKLFGQRKMMSVKLSENRQLRLDKQTFFGLSLQRLILTRCELTDFPLGALFPIIGLLELTLSENRIRFVPHGALALIDKLTGFYLDDNPLSCTCANKWLRESVNWDKLSPSVIRKSKLPTCKSPFNLMDIELTKVEPARFLCSPPRITAVELHLGQDSAALQCTASDDTQDRQQKPDEATQQSPPISWSYQHLPMVADATYSFPVLPGADSGDTFAKTFSRTPGFANEKFVIYARNSDGQASALNVSVEWPKTPPPPLPPAPGGEDKSTAVGKRPQPPQPPQPPPSADSAKLPPGIPERNPELQQADYYAQKQFTLLEMIVAVIGTFMATSLLFLLSCQFARWYGRRDRKRWANYAPQPYSAATYNYNAHQASSHEYDVPRIDQPCLLPKQAVTASAAGSSEFLDFSNPRLKYNV